MDQRVGSVATSEQRQEMEALGFTYVEHSVCTWENFQRSLEKDWHHIQYICHWPALGWGWRREKKGDASFYGRSGFPDPITAFVNATVEDWGRS